MVRSVEVFLSQRVHPLAYLLLVRYRIGESEEPAAFVLIPVSYTHLFHAREPFSEQFLGGAPDRQRHRAGVVEPLRKHLRLHFLDDPHHVVQHLSLIHISLADSQVQ